MIASSDRNEAYSQKSHPQTDHAGKRSGKQKKNEGVAR